MKFLRMFFILLFCLNPCSQAEEKALVPPPAESGAQKELFDKVCAVCHGKNGEGSQILTAPSIAGLPDWYILEQIEKFRADLRGTSSEDRPGQIMHNLVRALDDKQLQGVAGLIASMRMHPTQNRLGGDVEKGKEVFADTCMECHRFNGKGDKVFGSAPLIGLQDWYIRAQLEKFRKGLRGGSQIDEKGFKMHEMTQSLAQEDATNVTAYIAVLAKKYANQKPRRERELEAIRKKKAREAAAKNTLPKELRD